MLAAIVPANNEEAFIGSAVVGQAVRSHTDALGVMAEVAPLLAPIPAELPVFLRQSHAARDFAALGERLLSPESPSWRL